MTPRHEPASGTPTPVFEDPVATVARLAAAMRHRGVPVGPDRVSEAVAAMASLDVESLHDIYWAGRASLCSDRTHIAIYDELFARLRTLSPAPEVGEVESLGVNDDVGVEERSDPSEETSEISPGGSLEQLRRRSAAELSAEEREEILHLVSALRPRATRRARRRRAGGNSRVDMDKTIERMLHNGGEIVAIARDRPRTRPRRLVLLVDISESMKGDADLLLRFAYSAVRAAPTTTEVFTLGTRLTRLTPHFRHRAPAHAFAVAATAVEDWHGGTRLVDGIDHFLTQWGRRGTARGAVVVICSDGETDTPARLPHAVERLTRLAHSVIWAHPVLGKHGYLPVGRGLLDALMRVKSVVPAGSFIEMTALAAEIGDVSAQGRTAAR